MNEAHYRKVMRFIETSPRGIYALTGDLDPPRAVFIEIVKQWIDADFMPQVDFNSDYSAMRII